MHFSFFMQSINHFNHGLIHAFIQGQKSKNLKYSHFPKIPQNPTSNDQGLSRHAREQYQ